MDLLLSIIRILDSNEGPKTKQRFETWLEVNLVRGDRRTFQEELRTGEKCLVIKKKKRERIHCRTQNRASRVGQPKEWREQCYLTWMYGSRYCKS